MTGNGASLGGDTVLRGVTLRPEPCRLTRARAVPAAAHGASALRLPAATVAAADQARGAAPGQDAAYQESLRRGLQEGREKGYHEGLQKAAEAAASQLREAVDAAVASAQKPLREKAQKLDALLQSVARAADDGVQAAQDDIVALSFEVVCRMLGAQAVTREGVLAQLRETLEAWKGREPLTLHLHPDDARLLAEDEVLAQTLQGLHEARLQWQADESVTTGGCVLRCAQGGLDARLDVQLASFKSLLIQARAAQGARA